MAKRKTNGICTRLPECTPTLLVLRLGRPACSDSPGRRFGGPSARSGSLPFASSPARGTRRTTAEPGMRRALAADLDSSRLAILDGPAAHRSRTPHMLSRPCSAHVSPRACAGAVVPPAGIEPATSTLGKSRSIRLSYGGSGEGFYGPQGRRSKPERLQLPSAGVAFERPPCGRSNVQLGGASLPVLAEQAPQVRSLRPRWQPT